MRGDGWLLPGGTLNSKKQILMLSQLLAWHVQGKVPPLHPVDIEAGRETGFHPKEDEPFWKRQLPQQDVARGSARIR